MAKIHRCSVLSDHQWLVVAEMIGLSSAAISDLTRLTNQAAIEHRKSAPADAAAMRPARASQEANHV
jgi:hypothetical protein